MKGRKKKGQTAREVTSSQTKNKWDEQHKEAQRDTFHVENVKQNYWNGDQKDNWRLTIQIIVTEPHLPTPVITVYI